MSQGDYGVFLGGDRQRKCLTGDRQNNVWYLEDYQVRHLRNGRTQITQCGLTVVGRRSDKLGWRVNSMCFCVTHVHSHVSSEVCTFRCLVTDVCQRSGPVTCNEVRKYGEDLSSDDFRCPYLPVRNTLSSSLLLCVMRVVAAAVALHSWYSCLWIRELSSPRVSAHAQWFLWSQSPYFPSPEIW